MMDDLGEEVRRYLASSGVTQGQLADAAGISQSTVSRAISTQPRRSGQARRSLSIYMHQAGEAALPQSVFTALARTWDGSDAHAEALVGLILASRSLWPNMRKE